MSRLLLLCALACCCLVPLHLVGASPIRQLEASSRTYSVLDAPPLGHRDVPDVGTASLPSVGGAGKGYYDDRGYYHSDSTAAWVYLAIILPIIFVMVCLITMAIVRHQQIRNSIAMRAANGGVVIMPPGQVAMVDQYGNAVYLTDVQTTQALPNYGAPSYPVGYGDAPIQPQPHHQPASNGYPGTEPQDYCGEGRTMEAASTHTAAAPTTADATV